MKSTVISSLFVAVACMLVQTASAQFNETVKAQMVKDWERAKVYTKEYLDAMPADRYSLRAQDSIRTFAAQMMHLAQADVSFASIATGKERIWSNRNLENSPTAQSKDSVTYFVMGSYDFVLDAIKSMDASKLDEKVKGFRNMEDTRYAWLIKAFEHQTHHRGQTTVYIRVAGVKPPNEKLF